MRKVEGRGEVFPYNPNPRPKADLPAVLLLLLLRVPSSPIFPYVSHLDSKQTCLQSSSSCSVWSLIFIFIFCYATFSPIYTYIMYPYNVVANLDNLVPDKLPGGKKNKLKNWVQPLQQMCLRPAWKL